MYHCRIKDLRTNKIFEKDIPSYEFDAFQRKCGEFEIPDFSNNVWI